MIEREIRSSVDAAELIYLIKKKRHMTIKEISKTSGSILIHLPYWKAGKSTPRVDTAIKIFTTLNVEIVLSTNEFKQKVLTKEDIVNFISQIITIRNLGKAETFKKAEIHINAFALWKNKDVNPFLESVLRVLSVLDTKMVLRAYESEEERAESEIEKTEEVETMDTEHGETEISELEILDVAKKAFKNCNSLSEKERMYKVLQAFL